MHLGATPTMPVSVTVTSGRLALVLVSIISLVSMHGPAFSSAVYYEGGYQVFFFPLRVDWGKYGSEERQIHIVTFPGFKLAYNNNGKLGNTCSQKCRRCSSLLGNCRHDVIKPSKTRNFCIVLKALCFRKSLPVSTSIVLSLIRHRMRKKKH